MIYIVRHGQTEGNKANILQGRGSDRPLNDFVHHPAPEGMEPLAKVVDRLEEFLEMIRSEGECSHILIYTLAIAMKGALEYLTPEACGSFWGKYIPNCALFAFEYKDGAYSNPEEIRI